MFEIDKELQMTRNGGAVSDNYINVHKDSGEACPDQVRKMVTHSTDFKQYVWQNRQRMRTVVNNAGKFSDGPSCVTYFKTKKLNGKYESLDKIKSGSKKINIS